MADTDAALLVGAVVAGIIIAWVIFEHRATVDAARPDGGQTPVKEYTVTRDDQGRLQTVQVFDA